MVGAYVPRHIRRRRRSGRVPGQASPQGVGSSGTPAAARSANGPGSSARERVRHRSGASSERRRGTVIEAETIASR